MKIKLFELTCYIKGKEACSMEEDKKNTESRINSFCKGKKIVSIFPFKSYIVVVYI